MPMCRKKSLGRAKSSRIAHSVEALNSSAVSAIRNRLSPSTPSV